MIDSSCTVTLALEYPLATASPRAPERFRSVLFVPGGGEHPERQPPGRSQQGWPERDWPIGRAHVISMDPRRASPLRYPAARLYGEYVWAYVTEIRRAPLTAADRWECYRYLGEWLAGKAHLGRSPRPAAPVREAQVAISVDAAVASREKSLR